MQRGNLCCALLLAFACIGLARAQTIPTRCPCVPGTRNPSTHALTCFPFCNCNDYNPSSSPWLLTIVDISESVSGVSVTFQFTNVSSVPTTPSPCFKNFSANGIQKIQVDTFTTCNDANTDIFIGSTLCTGGCKVETPASYTNQRYFRVGSFTAKQAYAGTTFTIVGRGACGTLKTLLKAPAGQVFSYTIYKEFASNFICCPTGCGEFPPPPAPLPPASGTIPPPPSPPPPTRPPPAPPALFPHQSCKPGNIGSTTIGGIKGVPYNIDIIRVSSYPGAGTTGEHYCWDVKPQACRTSSSYPGCCDISLDKIELAVKEGCRNNAALKNIYAFGGKGSVALSSSTGFVPGTANTPSTTADVIKFTAIKYQNGPASLATIKSLAAAGQNMICFTIDPTRKCGTGANLFLQPQGLTTASGVEYAYWGTKPSSTAQCCGTEFTPL